MTLLTFWILAFAIKTISFLEAERLVLCGSYFYILFLKIILILCCHLRLGSQKGSYLHIFWAKFCIHFLSHPHVQCVPFHLPCVISLL
jgi:hypothetical protein